MSEESTQMSDFEIRGLTRTKRWDYENAYHWFSDSSRLGKVLAQYEIYKKLVGIPGNVFEFGVFKGNSLIRLATFREILESQDSRRIVAFDLFGKFPKDNLSKKSDLAFVKDFVDKAGDGLSSDEINRILNEKGFRNFDLVEGDVFVTVPEFIESNPQTRVSLLHLDLDTYEPTRFVLENLIPRVVPGGIVMVDDYGSVEGATLAVDEFVSGNGWKLESMPHYSVPAFFTKN